MIIRVTNQTEYEAALKKEGAEIELRGGVYVVYGSSTVRAYDSSTVRACDSSTVRATYQVPVLIMAKGPKVTGGVQIKYKTPTTAKEWLDNYGLKSVRGVVTLYKAVNSEFKSERGTSYAPGEKPKAHDWDGGKVECGAGLHFCAAPELCLQFYPGATKFIACPVKVSEIAVHKNPSFPTKVKAPRVYGACFEVDINGKKI